MATEPQLKTVTDPALIAQLEAASKAQQAQQPQMKTVTDPALIAQLEAASKAQEPQQPAAQADPDLVSFGGKQYRSDRGEWYQVTPHPGGGVDLLQVTDPILQGQLGELHTQARKVTDPNLTSQLEHAKSQQRSSRALGPLASSPVRSVAEMVMGLPNMVGDFLVGGTRMLTDPDANSAGNLNPYDPVSLQDKPLQGLGPIELPSRNFQRVLDHYTTPPATGFASFVEFADSILAGGLANIPARALGAATAATGRAANDAERLASLRQAHQLGYRIPPSEWPRNAVQKGAESISGSARLVRDMSRDNQEVTNRLAKVALGLHPEHPPLSNDVLQAIRDEAGQAYERLANTGNVRMDSQLTDDITHAGSQFSKLDRAFPGEPAVGPQGPLEPDLSLIERFKGRWLQPQFSAREGIDAMRYLYQQATTNLKTYDPMKNALGMVQRQIADAFRDRLIRHAQEIGQPQLAQDLAQARIRIAQTYTVENALNDATGNVSARKLAQQYANGAPLTDELQQIASSAATFPRALQDAERLGRGEGAFSVVDFLVGAGGWLDRPSLGVAILTRPLLRSALNSRAAQVLAARSAEAPPLGIGERIPGGLQGAMGGYQGMQEEEDQQQLTQPAVH